MRRKRRQREYHRECEERNFALRKLELENKRLTITPPVPSAHPSHSLRPSTSPVRVSSAHLNHYVGVSYSVAAASGGDSNAPPLDDVTGDSVTNAPVVPSPDVGDDPLALVSPVRPPGRPFDVSRNIRMVPLFNEREIEVYFTHFESCSDAAMAS